ncbi:Uncharacterised protein [Vibrio cholerae]|nr:Uncharacterised protein [Vibrio cholerae]CSH99410.1 Uncharacterised protein [Vibrio cholerae]
MCSDILALTRLLMMATESGDFDDVASKHNVRETETATNQTAVAKQLA